MGSSRVLSQIRVDHILPARFQARQSFPEEAIKQLADSMKEVGQNTPLLVRPAAPPEGAADSKDWYELICGECRLRAAKRLGWPTLWAVCEQMTDDDAALRGLVDNEQRRSLNLIERASGYLKLMNEYHLTQQRVCERSGVGASTLSRLLKLLDEPPAIQEMLRDGLLTEFHCRELDRLGDHNKRVAVAREVCKLGMSSQETAKRVQQVLGKKRPKQAKKHRPEDLAASYGGFRFWWEGEQIAVRAPNIKDITVRQYIENFRLAIEGFMSNEPHPSAASAGADPAGLLAEPAKASLRAPSAAPDASSTENNAEPAQPRKSAQDLADQARAVTKSFEEIGKVLLDLPKTLGTKPKK